MSQRRDHQTNSPQLDLKLNLPPTPPDSPQPESPTSSTTSSSSSESSSEMSIDGSCVSSEAEQDQGMSSSDYQSMDSRGSGSPMVLVGCPRCLMYVMLSDTNPKCPKCKSTVLLDFLNEEANKRTRT